MILHLNHSGSQVDACPVPSSYLVPWNGYPTIQPFNQFPHWLILKCTFSDDRTARTLPTGLNTAITDLDTYINLFLSLGGVGTGNILDYYRDVSYGGMDIETTVMGWYDAPFATNNTLNRYQRIQQAANAVPDSAGIDFSAYDGIVLVTNKPQDGGAWGVGKQAITIKNNDYQFGLVVFDPYSMYTAFAAHEVGHGLGLQHSYDNSNPPVEYGDPFDVMSALDTQQFGTPNYPAEAAESGTERRCRARSKHSESPDSWCPALGSPGGLHRRQRSHSIHDCSAEPPRSFSTARYQDREPCRARRLHHDRIP